MPGWGQLYNERPAKAAAFFGVGATAALAGLLLWNERQGRGERADNTPDTALREADIVGPVCETGDTFATAHALTDMPAGEFLVILDTGAFGAVMASGYNSRPLVPEVLVNGGDYALVRPRENVRQQLERERFADWQDRD